MTTDSVSITFNDNIYRQNHGVSMGSPLGPLMANIFVGFQERQLFDNVPKPYYHFLYVDDTFTCFLFNV